LKSQEKRQIESFLKSNQNLKNQLESEKIFRKLSSSKQISTSIRNSLFVPNTITQNCVIDWPGVLYSGTTNQIEIEGVFSCRKGNR
jgi:hypothetical protein